MSEQLRATSDSLKYMKGAGWPHTLVYLKKLSLQALLFAVCCYTSRTFFLSQSGRNTEGVQRVQKSISSFQNKASLILQSLKLTMYM